MTITSIAPSRFASKVMHKETLGACGRRKLPFAGYSVGSLILSGTIGLKRYASLVNGAARDRTPGTKYAGGHRIRVTPVPIPNTEVKPATADGTAWETAWESRSLPAVSPRAREPHGPRALRLYQRTAANTRTRPAPTPGAQGPSPRQPSSRPASLELVTVRSTGRVLTGPKKEFTLLF